MRGTRDCTCESCGETFRASRSDARYCSARCKKRAQRGLPPEQKPALALVPSAERQPRDDGEHETLTSIRAAFAERFFDRVGLLQRLPSANRKRVYGLTCGTAEAHSLLNEEVSRRVAKLTPIMGKPVIHAPFSLAEFRRVLSLRGLAEGRTALQPALRLI